jgi:hypothetical protein
MYTACCGRELRHFWTATIDFPAFPVPAQLPPFHHRIAPIMAATHTSWQHIAALREGRVFRVDHPPAVTAR